MKAVCSSETFLCTYKSTRRCYPEDQYLHRIRPYHKFTFPNTFSSRILYAIAEKKANIYSNPEIGGAIAFIASDHGKCHRSDWPESSYENTRPPAICRDVDGCGARKLSRVWTKTNKCRRHHYKAHCQHCVAPYHTLCVSVLCVHWHQWLWHSKPSTDCLLSFFSDKFAYEQKKTHDIYAGMLLSNALFFIIFHYFLNP
jgi:hypothetical protein